MDSSKYIFSADRRETLRNELESREFDLCVIGGGITGAGIALDAASRGLSVALVEKADFASGTSSRSTKLIHGGLRYLKKMEFRLVRNVGLERTIVYNNAPHLVVPEKMLLPLYKDGTYGKLASRLGLWLYDRLAGVAKEERRAILSADQVAALEPGLKKEGLKGAGYYSEYRTDDARLTLEIMKTAASQGAHCINYAECQSINMDSHVKEVNCYDSLNGDAFSVSSRAVVNAAGPWVDKVRKDHSGKGNKRLFLSKGVHLVFPASRLPVKQPIYFDVNDGRMVFAIPRGEVTYVGTTDTEFTGEPEEPPITKEDVEYLLSAVNQMFPNLDLSESDVVSSWSGVRPLIYEEGKPPSEMSRKDEIFISPKGLISIAGGKLTGYRLMAKKAVDTVCETLEIDQDCRSERIALMGGDFKHTDLVDHYIVSVRTRLKGLSLDPGESEFLVRTFGKQTDDILDKVREFEDEPLFRAILWFCLRNESVYHLSDFYIRRTGFLYFRPEIVDSTLEIACEMMAEFLSWDDSQVEIEKKSLKKLVDHTKTFV